MSLRVARAQLQRAAIRPGHSRTSVVATAAPRDQEVADRRAILMAAALVASSLAPKAAFADEAADKRKAEKARRKAILAASRSKAEASLTQVKDTAAADAETERKNDDRRRLAAERAASVEGLRAKEEYAKQAARAVQVAPPA